jgi:hypothetical protein
VPRIAERGSRSQKAKGRRAVGEAETFMRLCASLPVARRFENLIPIPAQFYDSSQVWRLRSASTLGCCSLIVGKGKTLFKEVCARDLEGIVAKPSISPYRLVKAVAMDQDS